MDSITSFFSRAAEALTTPEGQSTFMAMMSADFIFSFENATAIATAIAVIPKNKQHWWILPLGIAMAVAMRFGLAALGVGVLETPGLLFFGGVLLTAMTSRALHDVDHHIAEVKEEKARKRNPQAFAQAKKEVTKEGLLARGIGLITGAMAALLGLLGFGAETALALSKVTVYDALFSIDNVLSLISIAGPDLPMLFVGVIGAGTMLLGLSSVFVKAYKWVPPIGYVGALAIAGLGVKMMAEGAHDLPKAMAGWGLPLPVTESVGSVIDSLSKVTTPEGYGVIAVLGLLSWLILSRGMKQDVPRKAPAPVPVPARVTAHVPQGGQLAIANAAPA